MTKQETYQTLLPQIESLVAGEPDSIANMANVAAALHEAFGFWWTGFYRVEGQQLVLGPFQGPIACTRIPYGKGVCGTAWQRAETVIVPNVLTWNKLQGCCSTFALKTSHFYELYFQIFSCKAAVSAMSLKIFLAFLSLDSNCIL